MHPDGRESLVELDQALREASANPHAGLLVRHAPSWVADGFCSSRLDRKGQGQYGSLLRGTDCARIIERGMADCGRT